MASSLSLSFDPANEGLAKALGPLETEIMRFLWQETHSTVKHVHEHLMQQRTIAYTTVLTTMKRLADKGLLHRQREDNTDIYRPALSEADFAKLLVQQILDSLLDDHCELVVAHIVEYLTHTNPAKLQRILNGPEPPVTRPEA